MARTISISLPDSAAEEHFEAALRALTTIVVPMLDELDYTAKYEDEVIISLVDSLHSGVFESPSDEALAEARAYDSDEGGE